MTQPRAARGLADAYYCCECTEQEAGRLEEQSVVRQGGLHVQHLVRAVLAHQKADEGHHGHAAVHDLGLAVAPHRAYRLLR